MSDYQSKESRFFLLNLILLDVGSINYKENQNKQQINSIINELKWPFIVVLVQNKIKN